MEYGLEKKIFIMKIFTDKRKVLQNIFIITINKLKIVRFQLEIKDGRCKNIEGVNSHMNSIDNLTILRIIFLIVNGNIKDKFDF